MKRFSYLSIVLGALMLSLNACQKDTLNNAVDASKPLASTTDRSPSGFIYGVNVYNGVTPCDVVTIDQTSGTVTGTVNAFYIDPNGNNIALDNLKGICLTQAGQIFVTTGNPVNPSSGGSILYNNCLFKIDPTTGKTSYVSVSPIGTVSDLEYDPQSTNFYGLRNNSNAIIEIVDNGNNYGTYNGPFAITGIAAGYTLKGLSMVRDANGMYLVGCATNGSALGLAKLYRIPATGGAATFLTDVNPTFDLAGGHSALGFDLDLNVMLINRNGNAFGLNRFAWAPPFAPTTNSGAWGANGINFEDLTSSVY